MSLMPSALADLRSLRAEHGRGLYGSGGPLYRDAIFGRDAVQTAEDILHLRPEIAREVILTLGALQGLADAPAGPDSNEEERGKIHHEHRSLTIDGRRISAQSAAILAHLSAMWGGTPEELTYYGSVDATPLYARLVAAFCERHGQAVLDERVTRRDGSEATVRHCLAEALDWIARRIDGSDLGFVEFRRRNPQGITFQVWKDSGTSYIHLDGTIAQHEAPIAAVEVQGYAYDALLGGAALFPARADEFRERAAKLRTGVLERMWMPAERYFAMGVDRDAAGSPRWIESIASNAALLLDTRVFEGQPEAAEMVDPVVRRITGPDFMTEAGIRCRRLAESELVDFADYHGTWAVWGRDTFNVLKGLRRHGYRREAQLLGAALLNGVNAAGAHVEFLYVSPAGRVMYDYLGEQAGPDAVTVYGTNVPEAPQTWTVTAALATKRWFGSEPPPAESGLLGTAAEVRRRYEGRGDFKLDQAAAFALDQAARRRGTGAKVASPPTR